MEILKAHLADSDAEKIDFLNNCTAYLRQIRELQRKQLNPEKRARILASLGVGKQSSQYKKVKAVLDQFINEVQGDG